jgi:hypothetical protein
VLPLRGVRRHRAARDGSAALGRFCLFFERRPVPGSSIPRADAGRLVASWRGRPARLTGGHLGDVAMPGGYACGTRLQLCMVLHVPLEPAARTNVTLVLDTSRAMPATTSV